METTFNISKILTIFNDKKIYSVKLSKFDSEILKYSEVVLQTRCSVAKYKRYYQKLIDNGFIQCNTIFFHHHDDNSIHFRVQFIKL